MTPDNGSDWTGTILTIAGTIVATLFACLTGVMRWLGVKYEADLAEQKTKLEKQDEKMESLRNSFDEYKDFANNRAHEIMSAHERCLEDHKEAKERLRALEGKV